MDIRRLCREADAETVVDYLQMETKHKGKYTYILCPGHEKRLGRSDSNMGNAVLKEGGYYCFACATFVPTHDMVMEYTRCSSVEAYNIMAEAMGGKELYDGDDSENRIHSPKCRLSPEEAHIIGLCAKTTVPVKTDTGKIVQEGLYSLYQQNPTAYYGMIVKKAQASLKRYEYCKEHFASVSSDLAYQVYDLLGSTFDNSVYKKLERELDERIRVCERIAKIFAAAGAKGIMGQ